MIPHQYRGVAFTDVDFPLDEETLLDYFLTHQVYRRTQYAVAHHLGQFAVLEVTKVQDQDLFVDVADVTVLAGPDDCLFVDRPDIDTAVPSQLAQVAEELDAGDRAVIVRGLYEHVNFTFGSLARRVHVLDVAPPHPAKLVNQVERILDTAEGLPPVQCVPQVLDLESMARSTTAQHYLLPCRGGGVTVGDAEISYLDEVPLADPEWVLLGCARSRAIHDHFYPAIGAHLEQIDICPAALAEELPLPGGGSRLTKCCLLENHTEVRGSTVVVPWGASFSMVEQGLRDAAELAAAEPAGEGIASS